jgi:ankyrin repeat protein
MVGLFFDKGAYVDAGPVTVWQKAIISGRIELVELMLQKGIDVNAKDQYGMSFLGFALKYGKNDIVELLLTRGADLPSPRKDKKGSGALHNAAMDGYEMMTKMLLANGDNVDEKDEIYEFTALHYAARFGNKGVAEVLIANGADIKAKDKWDYQPIHWAAYHDRSDIVGLLLSKGADINAKTSLGQTPLQLALERRNTKTVELLHKHGAKEESPDSPI